MSTNLGNAAFLTNIQVPAMSPPQQSQGQGVFEVKNNILNLMRIKGDNGISTSGDNYGILTVALDASSMPTEADYANLASGRVYIDSSDANVLKMK